MGLDITAYRRIHKIDATFNETGWPIHPDTGEVFPNTFRPRSNPDFPGRMDDLEDGAVYLYMEDVTDRIGTYHYYNDWREALAELVGYSLTESTESEGRFPGVSHAAACWLGAVGPFSELIDFSDCEGTFGTEMSAKLAKDFRDWDVRASTLGDRFYRTYTVFRNAFEMASDGGAVQFH